MATQPETKIDTAKADAAAEKAYAAAAGDMNAKKAPAAETAKVEQHPRMEGRQMLMVLAPK